MLAVTLDFLSMFAMFLENKQTYPPVFVPLLYEVGIMPDMLIFTLERETGYEYHSECQIKHQLKMFIQQQYFE